MIMRTLLALGIGQVRRKLQAYLTGRTIASRHSYARLGH